jgi:hypothetical protein
MGGSCIAQSFWDLDESLKNTTFSNVFITDVRGHTVFTEPFVVRTYDKPIALARVAFESAKLIDDKLIFNVPFSIGLIVGTDTILARTAGDDAIVTIDLSEIANSANHKAIENEVSIFPNPTSNQLTITTDLTLQNAQYVVYSTNGQQVLNGSTNGTINVSSLNSGMY